MVKFSNIVGVKAVLNWYDNGSNQIAFSRGNAGFVAFNKDIVDFNEQVRTDLPDGTYCDVISGEKNGYSCTGKIVLVTNRKAAVIMRADDEYGVLAIHRESKL